MVELRQRVAELDKLENKRKRAKEELKKFKTITDKTDYGAAISDVEGNIVYINKSFANMHGYKQWELIGKNLSIFYTKEQIENVERLKEQLKQTGSYVAEEVWHKRKDGTIFPALMNGTDIKDDEGESLYLSATVIDISDHKRAEEALRKREEEEREKLQVKLIQSAKMAGIGTLASGIAHEFNNLLQIISGHVQLAQKTKKIEDVEEAFDIILLTTNRAIKIIKDLLVFSRQEALKKELSDIKEPIELVLSLTEGQLKKNNIKVERKYEQIPKLKVNKGEMQQVFLNLVKNACDSMLPDGGKLRISVRQVEESVKVSFHDTGKGIRKEDIDKLFEPFYTTKGAVEGRNNMLGTGLGLSVSYGIVLRHGGTIEVESMIGKGSTFTVKFPLLKNTPERISGYR